MEKWQVQKAVAELPALAAGDRLPMDALRNNRFFKELSESAFETLARQCHRRKYESGELIIGHHDHSFDVLFLLAGHARVNIYSSAGRRVSFREIREGTIFGELSAIDGQPRSASVEAVTLCQVAIMDRPLFMRSLREEPVFMMAVMTHLTQQVRNLTERVFEFSTLAVCNRVHAELLRIADPVESDNKAILSPSPTHEEIASRVSTHREAVTRELSRLEEIGIVTKMSRALRINDVKELRRLVEEGSV
jgi:CRP/FNR family cyclic AMP-dependent transcriptional regulator